MTKKYFGGAFCHGKLLDTFACDADSPLDAAREILGLAQANLTPVQLAQVRQAWSTHERGERNIRALFVLDPSGKTPPPGDNGDFAPYSVRLCWLGQTE